MILVTEKIKICERWVGTDGFANFLSDMGDRPESLTLDRIDNLGNYEPTNCRWATRTEQARNTSQTVHVTLGDDTHSINEWCDLKGIGYHLVKQRRQRGMSVEDALTAPLDYSKAGRKRNSDGKYAEEND